MKRKNHKGGYLSVLMCVLWLSVASLSFALEKTEIPAECQGKEIKCEMQSPGSCTAMYCGGLQYIYDSNGNYLRTENDCNHYLGHIVCSCNGNTFFPKVDPLR